MDRAVLDLVIQLPSRGTVALDVAIVETSCAQYRDHTHKSRQDVVTRLREAAKHRRYPQGAGTPELVPLVYETGGRAGRQADALVRSLTRASDEASRAEAMADLRQRVAVALVRGVAMQLLRAGEDGHWPWR